MHNNTLVIGLSQRTYPVVCANEIIMFGCLVKVRMDALWNFLMILGSKKKSKRQTSQLYVYVANESTVTYGPGVGGGGSTWVFFGWVCAAQDSKLAPHSKKNSLKIDRNGPIFYTPF